jgi:hypothetical protein
MAKYLYSVEELLNAAYEATSIPHALRLMGQNPSSKNQKIARKRLIALGFDVSIFSKLQRTRLPKATIENALIKDSPYSPQSIRRLVEREKLLPYDCCGLKGKTCLHKANNYDWIDGIKVPFHLHHINGDTRDNRLENLSFICITCHSLTLNFGGKSRKGR